VEFVYKPLAVVFRLVVVLLGQDFFELWQIQIGIRVNELWRRRSVLGGESTVVSPLVRMAIVTNALAALRHCDR
jgi:hypothetical protein